MAAMLPVLTVLALFAVATSSAAQDNERRYLPDPSDEDWSFLEHAARTDIWDPVKYIPLGRAQWFTTLSGEVRYRPEGFRVHPSGTTDGTVDSYLLQRYLFGADTHLGARARLFVEVQSGIINGALRSPRPTDRNQIDLHQGFFEWRHAVRGRHVIRAKAGRQELSVGSTRLISASPGLNVKRSFDGLAVSYRGPSWTLVGTAARLVRLAGGAFDDRSESGQEFWGIAAGRRSPGFDRGELAIYYLTIDRSPSVYVQGIGREHRQTVGLKWAGSGGRLEVDYDGLFQWGTFADAPIRAWAFATETAYRGRSVRWRPRLSVRADIASGDADPGDPRLGSFNPLFPGNSYSGATGLLGPTNLADLTPAFTFALRSNVTVGLEAPSYWRTSVHDGVYGTNLRPLIRPEAGDGAYVGTNPGGLVVYQATRHLQLQGVVTRFLAGRFVRRTFVSSGFGFYSGSVVYRF
jgi:hypothetical protein